MLLLVCQANEFSKTGCTIMDSMSHFIAASLRGERVSTSVFFGINSPSFGV
jgi:hypothetical protein